MKKIRKNSIMNIYDIFYVRKEDNANGKKSEQSGKIAADSSV